MFQSSAEIRTAILEVFGELHRAATPPEISAGVWFRSSVDGTRSQVHDAVIAEMLKMLYEGVLEGTKTVKRAGQPTLHYVQPEVLTRLAIIPE